MTAEEALAIVETALDEDEQLNDVQELIFRQCWEGRHSYDEIANSSKYDDEYIKSAGAKLWKLLSEAFDEKVKKNNLKSVLKRYLRRHQITLHRTQVIGVNLSGANLSGARLLLTNLSEADFYQTDLNKSIVTEDNTASDEIVKAENDHNQGIESHPKERIYHWNDLRFRCEEEVKIAEALDRTSVLFFPNSKARLTTPAGPTKPRTRFSHFPPRQMGNSRNIASRHRKR
ncbi:pentapeptide repeat-containing protein [Microcoleus sp. B4-D4]|uniref:pentapeptide repeat-containing protein n=1 Tax=Microcoleus sp. B4-D4 TaxID=2818667 RepID=UPI002FCF3E11